MKQLNEADSAQEKKPLEFIIEGVTFKTTDEYKTGAELKILRGIPLEVELYLKIHGGYEDELIGNDKEVNLARPKEEVFYVKEKYEFSLDDVKYTAFAKVVTGGEIFSIAGITDVKCFDLYQKLEGCDFEKISLHEEVDLSNKGIEKFITKNTEIFNYTVNGQPEMTDEKYLTTKQILANAGIDSDANYLIQVFPDGTNKQYAYTPEENIIMTCKGLVFESAAWLEIVDVEEYGKECKQILPARNYRIKIDKAYHIVNDRFITPAKIIQLGGKPETTYDVYKFMNGNPKPIKVTDVASINLTEQCLVRFVLQPKEQQDGRGNRQQFSLPEEDVETLEKIGLQWETLSLPGMWLIIYDYPIPAGYNVQTTTMALMITSSYPLTEIDMAHFSPPLSKSNGKAISAVSNHTIDGKTFQQWSRHRHPGQWMAGVDNIATHLSLVDNWLNNDLNR